MSTTIFSQHSSATFTSPRGTAPAAHLPQVRYYSESEEKTYARRPHTRRTFSKDPFLDRFGTALPEGLKEEAEGMSWREFFSTYSPTGAVSIRHLSSERLRMGRFRFTATLSMEGPQGRTTATREIIATGPVSACTNLLADAGRRVEIVRFHQYEIFQATVTFIRTHHHGRYAWAMGFGADAEQSAATALSAAAHRLHQPAA